MKIAANMNVMFNKAMLIAVGIATAALFLGYCIAGIIGAIEGVIRSFYDDTD